MIKKTLRKLGIERNFLNVIKDIYEKPTVNIILSGDRLNFLPEIRNVTKMLLSPLLFGTVLKVLDKGIGLEKEKKKSEKKK